MCTYRLATTVSAQPTPPLVYLLFTAPSVDEPSASMVGDCHAPAIRASPARIRPPPTPRVSPVSTPHHSSPPSRPRSSSASSSERRRRLGRAIAVAIVVPVPREHAHRLCRAPLLPLHSRARALRHRSLGIEPVFIHDRRRSSGGCRCSAAPKLPPGPRVPPR